MNGPVYAGLVGQLRPSQMLHTFGVGAIVDLPNIAAMIMGIDDWNVANTRDIGEERLLAAVRGRLGSQVQSLKAPPMPPETYEMSSVFDAESRIGVPVAVFPRWLRCPYCSLLARVDSGLFELKIEPGKPDRTRYVHANCMKPGHSPTAVPARFLVSCPEGHLDDFPWIDFVHEGQPCDAPQLRLEEYGVAGTASDVWVRCTNCDKKSPMSKAFGEEAEKNMPQCRGRRPHLRDFEEEGCKERMRTLLLGASNSWFSVNLSSLSIPRAGERLGQLIEENWSVLSGCTSLETFKAVRGALAALGQLSTLSEFDDDEIWRAIEERQQQESIVDEGNVADLKSPEWEVFSNPSQANNGTDFRLRVEDVPRGLEKYFSNIVLVDRLREVRALVGFTRIESPGDYADPGEIPSNRMAPISRKPPNWVPASETRGEGLFIQFQEKTLQKWEALPKVIARSGRFLKAHRQWRKKRELDPPESGFPGIRYVLLHSFSHALMRQLALECGYTAASIRERIYSAGPHAEKGSMAGVLLYTAAPDSEGTLGGLVSLGDPRTLGRHIEQALGQMQLCSSDPLCAERNPDLEGRTLHAAACHACLFSAETSCERGNKYLDRSVLVETVGCDGCAFFERGSCNQHQG